MLPRNYHWNLNQNKNQSFDTKTNKLNRFQAERTSLVNMNKPIKEPNMLIMLSKNLQNQAPRENSHKSEKLVPQLKEKKIPYLKVNKPP